MRTLLKNRFMISTIAFALLLVALVVLVIVPSFSEIRLINEQVIEERRRLEELYTRGQVQKTVQENYNAVKDDAAFLNGILLKENQELQYLEAVEALADGAGIRLDVAVGPQKRVPEQRYSELSFTFTASGDWEAFLRFLDRLESLPYYTNVGEVTVAVRTDEQNRQARSANVTVSATTYWRIPSLETL